MSNLEKLKQLQNYAKKIALYGPKVTVDMMDQIRKTEFASEEDYQNWLDDPMDDDWECWLIKINGFRYGLPMTLNEIDAKLHDLWFIYKLGCTPIEA